MAETFIITGMARCYLLMLESLYPREDLAVGKNALGKS